jgi:hypothetical protein
MPICIISPAIWFAAERNWLGATNRTSTAGAAIVNSNISEHSINFLRA